MRASPFRLYPSLLILAASVACSKPAQTPNQVKAEPSETAPLVLLGARARRVDGVRIRYVFDLERVPRLLVPDGITPPHGFFELNGYSHEIRWAPIERRDGLNFTRAASIAPSIGSPGEGIFRIGSKENPWGEWAIEWARPPSSDRTVERIQSLRKAGQIDEARVLAEAGNHWVAAERARLRSSDPAQAINAWIDAAEAAEAAGMTSEVAARLQNAAYFAIWRSEYLRAARLLDQVEEIDAVLKIDRSVGTTAYYRALIHQALGRDHAAIEAFSKAAKHARLAGQATGYVATYHIQRAQLLRDLGRYTDAIAALDRADALYSMSDKDEDRRSYLTMRGTTLLLGMLDGALPADYAAVEQIFQEGLEQTVGGHEKSDLYTHLAFTQLAHGELAQASRSIERARRFNVQGFTNVESVLLDGRLTLLRGKYKAALALFGKARELADAQAAGGVSDFQWRADYWSGSAYLERGLVSPARRRWERGLAALEAVGASRALKKDRAPFRAAERQLIEDLTQLYLDLDRPASAMAVADRALAHRLRSLETQARIEHLPAHTRRQWDRALQRYLQARTIYEQDAQDGQTLSGRPLRIWTRARAKAQRALKPLFMEMSAALDQAAPPRVIEYTDRQLMKTLGPGEALLMMARQADTWIAFRATRDSVQAFGPGDDSLTEALEGLIDSACLYVVDGGHPGARALRSRSAPDDPTTVWGERVAIAELPYAAVLLRRPLPAVGDSVVFDGVGSTEATNPIILDMHHIDNADVSRHAVLDALAESRSIYWVTDGEIWSADPWDLKLGAGAESVSLADVLTHPNHVERMVISGAGTPIGAGGVDFAKVLVATGTGSVLTTNRPVSAEDRRWFLDAFYTFGGANTPAEALRKATAYFRGMGDPTWSAWRLVGRR